MGDLADEAVEQGYAEQCERDLEELLEAEQNAKAMAILERAFINYRIPITSTRRVEYDPRNDQWAAMIRDKYNKADWTIVFHGTLARAIIAAAEYKRPKKEGT